MGISDHILQFMGLPVRNFTPSDRAPLNAETAYGLCIDDDRYKDGYTLARVLDAFLAVPGASEVKALVIGDWGGAMTECTAAPAIEALAERAPRLPGLRGLFFGEMTYDECEISWIHQGDLSPLWKAFQGLEVFRVRGGCGLSLGEMALPALRELAIEASGLERAVVEQVCAADLPALESLELWMGPDDCCYDPPDGDDLLPILGGECFPTLTHLGFRNTWYTDEIAEALVEAPIMRRLHSLDLSLGSLSDDGAKSLLALPADIPLRRIDIHHHYVSPALVEQLAAKGYELDASEALKAEDGGDQNYYIAVME